jgi:D-inositol-3-phosphate glycosyltransferase
MATFSSSTITVAEQISTPNAYLPVAGVAASLLTGGFDKPYVFGLAMALASKGALVDIVGGEDVDCPEMHTTPRLRFLNLRGNKGKAGFVLKAWRVLLYYARLVRYAAIAQPKVFHILWNNKFEFFDRTLLMLYYKMLGKKIVFTAHNVNAGKRDSNDSWLNRATLGVQYRLADHIFVHTEAMKHELLRDFRVPEKVVSVIPFGINNSVPDTTLTPRDAKRQLGLQQGERTALFFGSIRPYKGLEYLVDAFLQVAVAHSDYRLIIAGQPGKGTERYLSEIQGTLSRHVKPGHVLQKIEYIPDEQTELYFKAADVVVLPYTEVYQSGVLFLAYSFGLPVVAADVGAFRENIISGETGYLCRPCDSADLARAIETYFGSELFKDLDQRRPLIRDYANSRNSWTVVAERTRQVYSELSAR